MNASYLNFGIAIVADSRVDDGSDVVRRVFMSISMSRGCAVALDLDLDARKTSRKSHVDRQK